jgi:hypothetical protein
MCRHVGVYSDFAFEKTCHHQSDTNYKMTFTQSAENIRLDEGHLLRASLRNMNGDLVDAEFDLDQVIGNNWGPFAPQQQLFLC